MALLISVVAGSAAYGVFRYSTVSSGTDAGIELVVMMAGSKRQHCNAREGKGLNQSHRSVFAF